MNLGHPSAGSLDRRASLSALVAFVVLTALTAITRASALDVVLESSRVGSRRLWQFRGQPAVIIEENRAAQGQSTAWAQRLVRDPAFPTGARLVAVADVAGYHFWPAEGFVRSAVRDRARRDGVEILIDWDGALRREFGFVEGLSNLVVLGPDGSVLLRVRGPFTDDTRGRVLASLLP